MIKHVVEFAARAGIPALSSAAALLVILIGVSLSLRAQPTIGLPVATQTALSGASLQVIGVNPTRRSINICNGTGGVASCTPSNLTPTAANGVQIAASACFTPPAYLLSSGSAGGAGAAWNCIGTTNITVLEW